MAQKASKTQKVSGSLPEQAQAFMDAQDYAAARDVLLQALKEERTAPLQYMLARSYVKLARVNEATLAYEAALKLDPGYHRAYAGLAELLLSEGHVLHALDHYVLAMKAKPDEMAYRQIYLTIGNMLHIKAFNKGLKDILLECLEIENLDHSKYPKVWGELLWRDPAFKALLKAVGNDSKDTYAAFCKALAVPANRKALLDPYLLLCLQKVMMANIKFEKWMTYLRRFLLENLNSEKNPFALDQYLILTGALSCYALLTEYVFDVTADEQKKIDALQEKAETANFYELCILACYMPLSVLPRAAGIADRVRKAMPGFVSLHIDDYLAQKNIRGNIQAITKIDDRISARVQEQYEEFPYPRWKTYSSVIFDEEVEKHLIGAKARMLVAGCGTGREAIELATAFPDARVLAVDLSRTSLAYGIKRVEDNDIKNVEFRQGDILGLGVLDEKFDYIASGGVLHHMENPAKGLAVLTGLLKPGGLMRLGLYSELARQSVVKARQVIAEKKYASDTAGIHRFRREASQVLEKDTYEEICGFRDYFCLPECRDLLFHVQEHRFTIPQLKDFLAGADLEFMKFYHYPQVIAQFRKQYPDDPECANLDNWAAFEEKNPRTFVEMYRFWCRKKD